VDPASGLDEIRDLGVADALLVPPAAIPAATVHDLSGKVVTPGFIDLHVHLREPGQTHKETIAAGARAAAVGGFAAIVAMPNTTPAIDCPVALEDVLARIRRDAVVKVLQTAALTQGRAGETLTDAAALKAGGAVALTDDGSCIQDAGLMLRAMRNARAANIPVVDHCEIESLAGAGAMHAGACAQRLGLPGKSGACEELAVARDAILARETGCPVHVQHISSAGAVSQVRFAQQQGAPLTAEASPHHICLTEEACLEHGANAKMNPPLRAEADRQAIIAALRDGVICAIATDHAPHAAEEKSVGFAQAPCGIIGLEAAVPLCLTELYHTGLLTLNDLVAKFTDGPRRVLRLPTGALEIGAPADLTVLDLNVEFALDVRRFQSLSRNCPYHGRRCRGKAVGVMVNGAWIHSELPGIPGLV